MIDIGEVVASSGIPTSTLHLWEREGLIEPVGRNGLRRQYAENVLQRLAVVVVAQRSGFTIAEIRDLLSSPAAPDGRERIAEKLTELESRRHELDQAIDGLRHALACTAPTPMECETFLAQLDEILPVDRS